MHRSSLAAASALVLVLILAFAPASHAQVLMMRNGGAGPVSLLNFGGGYEAPPTSQTDPAQAAVECYHNARGRRAVFAGALAWAADLTTGLGNDWQYVRVVAGAVDTAGRALVGETSPFYVAHDNVPVSLPAVGTMLPNDSMTYTPVLVVQFYDSTYRLMGSAMVGAQSGAVLVSLPTPPYGDYWYVSQSDLVQCG